MNRHLVFGLNLLHHTLIMTYLHAYTWTMCLNRIDSLSQILSNAGNNSIMEAVEPEVSVTCIDLSHACQKDIPTSSLVHKAK